MVFSAIGQYKIDQIYVDTDLKDVSSYIQYFQIPKDLYEDVKDDRADIVIEIIFVDDRERKKAELNVNGRLTYINQNTPYYARNVNPFIGSGNNYIELRPETTLNINEIKVSVY